MFISFHFELTAQPLKRYKTFSYSVNEGLLQSTIADMEIDRNNFCWISFPNGIQKFDGENFQLVPIQPGLPDDKNANFYKCKNGDFLISHSRGITKYDIESNRFKLIYNCTPSNNQSPYFIGEIDGIIYFTLPTGSIIELDSDSYKKLAETKINFDKDLFKLDNGVKISSNIIDHKVIFLQQSILYLWDLQKRELITKSKQFFSINTFFLKMKSGNEVLFHRTGINFLSSYNFSTGLTNNSISEKLKFNNNFRCNLFSWHKKNMVSLDNDLFETDKEFLEIKTQLVNFQNQSIANSAINVIREDNFGNLWVSTVSGGIRKIINSNYQIKYYGITQGNKNNALTIFPDKKIDRVLLGTSKGGLFIYDTTQRLIRNIIKIPGDDLPIAVNQIIKNSQNEYFLFMAGAKFIARLSPDLKSLTRIPIKTSITAARSGLNYFANFLYQNDREAVVQSQSSIYRLKFSDNSVRQYEFTSAYTHSGFLYHGQIITHSNDELLFLDTADFHIVKRIPFKNTGGVRSFARSGDDLIYMGTNKGIFKIDQSGKILEQYNRSTGLPDECIYTIILDKDNNLWCSTNKGIIKINRDKNFLQVTREDGLQENEFNTNAMAVANDGEYFYGGVNGGSSFFPAAIKAEDQKLNVIITNIQVNNEEMIGDTAAWNISKISLPYDQNLLSFDFTAMGNSNPGQYVYQYRMMGIDDRWIINKDLQTVRYFLPPGKYTLQIYASRYFNNNAHPLKEISITIDPPFWKTWWFISGIGLLCLVTMIYIINSFVRRAYQKKLRLLEAEKNMQMERERISRDLHDNIGGYANALLYKSGLLENDQDNDSRDLIISDLRFASKEIITSLRETIWALKKTNYSAQDCLIRIRNFIQPFNNYYPFINFKVEGDASEDKDLSHSTALHIVRIIQEAVTNAIKHASSKNIIVTSKVDDKHWVLGVYDDGKGFDADTYAGIELGNGLLNMKKRSEEADLHLQINSTPGVGTSINLII
ncbi:MAG: triple tyrosine motif-containing protein [Ginsengibacter sp.]